MYLYICLLAISCAISVCHTGQEIVNKTQPESVLFDWLVSIGSQFMERANNAGKISEGQNRITSYDNFSNKTQILSSLLPAKQQHDLTSSAKKPEFSSYTNKVFVDEPEKIDTGASAYASGGSGGFEQKALEAHNKFRALHNAPPMSLNNELSQQAKAYAQKIAALGILQHSSDSERGKDVGENLAMGCSTFGLPLTATQAVNNWYNEVCQYDFNKPGFSNATGHFTQVVWQDSKELGIGKAMGKRNFMSCVYVVGRYRTVGNYNNMFQEKVLKGSFDKSYCVKD